MSTSNENPKTKTVNAERLILKSNAEGSFAAFKAGAGEGGLRDAYPMPKSTTVSRRLLKLSVNTGFLQSMTEDDAAAIERDIALMATKLLADLRSATGGTGDAEPLDESTLCAVTEIAIDVVETMLVLGVPVDKAKHSRDSYLAALCFSAALAAAGAFSRSTSVKPSIADMPALAEMYAVIGSGKGKFSGDGALGVYEAFEAAILACDDTADGELAEKDREIASLNRKLVSAEADRDAAKRELEAARAELVAAKGESARLEGEKADLSEQLADMHARYDGHEAELEDSKRLYERKRAELDEAIRKAGEMKAPEVDPLQARAADALLNGGVIKPSTPSEAFEMARRVFSAELEFSNKAKNDVVRFNGDGEEMWDALSCLARHWLPAAKAGRPPEARAFSSDYGFEVSGNESEVTRGNRKLMSQRRATVEGRRIVATHHLKGSSNVKGKALRIHFAYDDETSKLAIIRCGNHLDTAGTRRRGH